MILHPGILALLVGSTVVLLMLAYAAMLGVIIVCRWDLASSSATQLALERKTYLISTIMNYVLGFLILSAFLFLYTVDDIHQLFVGAMCATGSLNANSIGWYGLVSKIVVFFLAGFWIALNHIDQQQEHYPLVRLKYFLLIVFLPVIGLDLFLQVRYFTDLDPDVITSCCGSLFSESGPSVASNLAALPVRQTMAAFYAGAILYFAFSFLCLRYRLGFLRYIQSATVAVLFLIALAAVVSFVSIYIYELPTHHCPFDIVQKHYNFIGYPLYLSLFVGCFFGLLPGIFQPLKRRHSLQGTIASIERRWLYYSMACLFIFVVVATYSVVFSNLSLRAYF